MNALFIVVYKVLFCIYKKYVLCTNKNRKRTFNTKRQLKQILTNK